MVNATMKKRKPSPERGRSRNRANSDSADWIYGTHAALAAIANPSRKIRRIAAAPQVAETHETALGIHPVDILDRRDIDALVHDGAVHQGIAVLASPLPGIAIEDIIDQAAPLDTAVVVILDQATDPRNIGSVLRSAAAFGAMAVAVHDQHAPPITGSLAKAASGALETVPLVRLGNLARHMNMLKDGGFWCVGLDGYAEADITKTDLNGKAALVFGAEGTGLRRLTRETCDTLARIPIQGSMESLNLSNAVAVTLYEAARRGA